MAQRIESIFANVTNEEKLRRMITRREVVQQFKTRKVQYIGQMSR